MRVSWTSVDPRDCEGGSSSDEEETKEEGAAEEEQQQRLQELLWADGVLRLPPRLVFLQVGGRGSAPALHGLLPMPRKSTSAYTLRPSAAPWSHSGRLQRRQSVTRSVLLQSRPMPDVYVLTELYAERVKPRPVALPDAVGLCARRTRAGGPGGSAVLRPPRGGRASVTGTGERAGRKQWRRASCPCTGPGVMPGERGGGPRCKAGRKGLCRRSACHPFELKAGAAGASMYDQAIPMAAMSTSRVMHRSMRLASRCTTCDRRTLETAEAALTSSRRSRRLVQAMAGGCPGCRCTCTCLGPTGGRARTWFRSSGCSMRWQVLGGCWRAFYQRR